MKKDISPEEKLLNVIRAKKDDAVKLSAEKHDPYFMKFENAKSSANITGLSEKNFSNTEKKWFNKIGELKYLNIGLFVFLVVLGGYLLFEIFNPSEPPQLAEVAEILPKEEKPVKDLKEGDKTPEKNVSYYTEGVSGKELFRSGAMDSGESTVSRGADEEKVIADTIANLSLLGIIKGDSPQAIIEDKKNQRSYFLSKGESLGEIKIIEIFENKVVIGLKGKEYELVL